MQAVIMAGGEGSRLRPMTCCCPKPMVPIVDRPVMAYALELLSRHGIRDCAVTLMYLPNVISDYFADGSEFGVNLKYYTETAPLGTAGSVAMARGFLNGTFVVLSGDGITDCDITRAVEFHREKKAEATMVLKKVASPLEYGVVLTDQNDRVRRFVEKPGWGEACSDAVNTGIYVLEPSVLDRIPQNRPCDFGRDLFPALVAEGARVYGFAMDGYWCDVGDTQAYLKANFDVLDGKVRARGVRPGFVNRAPGSVIDKSAVLQAPCYIAPGARIEAGARIGAYSVIGSGSVIGPDASVKRSVVWRGARAGERACLRGCCLLNGAVASDGVSAFEESVIGSGARIGDGAAVMSGVRIWPGKFVEDGERVDRNVVWGQGVSRSLCDGVFAVYTPSRAADDAMAYAGALGVKRVCVGRDASLIAQANLSAVTAGLMAQGVQVIDAQKATLPLVRFAQSWAMADGALYVAREGITALDASGAGLDRAQCRKISSIMARCDCAMPFSGLTKPPLSMTGCDMAYIASVLKDVSPGELENARVALFCPNDAVLSLAERVLLRAGASVRGEWEEEMMELAQGEIGVWLDETGQKYDLADEAGALSGAERTLTLCWAALESGEKELILPRGQTRVAEELAKNYGASLRLTPSDENSFQRELIKAGGVQFALHFDAIRSLVILLRSLRGANTTMRGALGALSPRFRRTRVIPLENRDKGKLIRRLSETMEGCDATDGITVEREEGWAFINPRGDKRECVVTAEALSAEYAKELCDMCAARIQEITAGKK